MIRGRREVRPDPADRQPGHQLEAAADGARDRQVRQARARSTSSARATTATRDSGAWIYPIPPDADPKTVNWDMFLGPGAEAALQPRALLPLARYWDYSGGIATDLFVHLMTTIHYVMDATVPEHVMATGANYRHQKTHEVPDTLNASAVYGKENFSVSLGGTFNSSSAGESGFAILGNEGSLVFRGDRMIFTPEHVVEGNGWIVELLALDAREGVLGRPRGPEERDAGRPGRRRWRARASRGRRSGRDSTDIHVARFFDSVRTRKPAVEDGRHGPPRGRRRPHGERVDQAEGPSTGTSRRTC